MKFRMIVFVTMLLYLFGCMPVFAEFVDTEGLQCDEAVAFLAAIGVVEGKGKLDTFMPQDTLTRAEAATMLVRFVSNAEFRGDKDVFTDVTTDHWAYSYISAAYEMGLVGGIGETLFAPDAMLQYAQAVKMVVALLGYSAPAEAAGGYPTGYLIKADALKLLDGVQAEKEMTRGNMAVLLYNAMDVAPMRKELYGADNGKYIVDENNTLLSLYKDIFSQEDILTCVYGAAVKTLSVSEKQFAVGDTIYTSDTVFPAAYIGQRVKVYYAVDGDVRTALFLTPAKQTSVLRIDAGDIMQETTKAFFRYDGIQTGSCAIASDAILVLNGKPKVGWTKEDLIPKIGMVTLIINSSGGADVVLVDSYRNYVVDNVNTDKQMIYLKENADKASISTEDESGKHVVLQESDGTPIELADLKRWDVLSVLQSEDETYTKIIRSTADVIGTVSEIAEDYIKIGDTIYRVALGMRAALTLNKSGKFCLDYMGRVAAVDSAASRSFKYGYLVGAETTKGISGVTRMKVFTEDKEMLVLEAAENISFDGENIKNTDLYNRLPKVEGVVQSQLVRFETNAEKDAFTKMDLAKDNTSVINWGGEEFSKDYYIDRNGKVNGTEIGFRAGYAMTFASRMMLRADTVIFSIPDKNAPDDEYTLVNYTSLITSDEGNNPYKNISLYDVDAYGIVGAMVWDFGDSGEVATGTLPHYTDPQALVTAVSIACDEKTGEVGRKITLMTTNGGTDSFFVKDDFKMYFKGALTTEYTGNKDINYKVTAENLHPGDVIQYKKQGKEIEVINVMFRAQTPKEGDQYWGLIHDPNQPHYGIRDKNYSMVSVAYGTVVCVGEESIVINVPNQTNPAEVFTRVYAHTPKNYGVTVEYNMTNMTAKETDIRTFAPGDKIFIACYTTTTRFIIQYKSK